jgi:hypothetical protein
MVWIPFFKAGASFGRTGWGVIKVLGTPARVPLWAKMRRRPCVPRLSSHGCVVYTSYLIIFDLSVIDIHFCLIFKNLCAHVCDYILQYIICIYTCTSIWLNIYYMYIQLAHIYIHIYISMYNYVGRWVTNMHRIYECSVCMNIFAIMYQKIQHPTRQYIHTISSL